MSYDWGKFTQKININASVAEVYRAWTSVHHLEQWFLRKATIKDDKGKEKGAQDTLHNGDTYEWLWHGHADTVIEKGKILLANGTDKLQFSFTKGAVVTVHIGEMLGESIVMLTQEGIPTDDEGKVKYHIGCIAGWTFYLTNLKSYLEGGKDLRNKNIMFSNVVNS
jgi:uncharacterized protein YndB with AHSA1/START domain